MKFRNRSISLPPTFFCSLLACQKQAKCCLCASNFQEMNTNILQKKVHVTYSTIAATTVSITKL